MQWKFYLGASFLTAALLLPHARAVPVLGGVALAGVAQFIYSRFGRK